MSEAKKKLFGLFRSRATSEKTEKDSKHVLYQIDIFAWGAFSANSDRIKRGRDITIAERSESQ